MQKLRDNSRYFREQIIEAGFKPLAGETPIVPIIIGETSAAIQVSEMMLAEGVYLAPSAYEAGFVSSAHGDAEIAATVDAAARTFKALAMARR